jgi:hypothetical protein
MMKTADRRNPAIVRFATVARTTKRGGAFLALARRPEGADG